LHVPIECRSGAVTLDARAENVSISGILIRTPTPFGDDEEITLRFTLPGAARRIECRARVAHAVADSFMGVEFVDLSPESLAAIEKYVAETPALQAGPKR